MGQGIKGEALVRVVAASASAVKRASVVLEALRAAGCMRQSVQHRGSLSAGLNWE